MIPIFLMNISFLLILFGAECLYRFTKVPSEWIRKIQHIVSGILAACFPWIFSSPTEVLSLGAMMSAALFIFRKTHLLTSLYDVKRKTLGEFYFLVSIVLLSYLAWDLPLFYLISILTLTFSDSMAALVGTKWQKYSYSIKGHTKSLEGSSAFFVSTLFFVFLPLLFFTEIGALKASLISFVIAILVTLVEALCRKGMDNLLIPLSTFYLLVHLSSLPLQMCLFELAASLSLLCLGWFFLQKTRPLSIISFSGNDSQKANYFKEPVDAKAVCMVLMKNKTPLATLTIQKKENLGIIGHYDAKHLKAGVQLLNAAVEKLFSLGVKKIVGPMNGNTWGKYRLPLDDKTPFFLGEPNQPACYNDHFTEAGFAVEETYESRITKNLSERKESYIKLGGKIAKLGIIVGSLNMERFDDVLKEIFEMNSAFQENPFYESISFHEFHLLYQKMKPHLKADFVQLAYDREKRLIGYAFSYEDAHDPSQLIFKTLATNPNVRASGLGVYLFDRIHWIAALHKKKAVIHALMHEKHNSIKLSESMKSHPFRSYALYAIQLRDLSV